MDAGWKRDIISSRCICEPHNIIISNSITSMHRSFNYFKAFNIVHLSTPFSILAYYALYNTKYINAQLIERGTLPMLLPVVRFRIPLGAGFPEKYHVNYSPLNLGKLLRSCVLGQGTSPSNASLDSGENEYLVGQRWQCVRLSSVHRNGFRTVCSPYS